MLNTLFHYSLHLLVPAGIAWVFFRSDWLRVYLLFLATMLVDLDHLFATPLFDPQRCSIGFHPLHTEYAMIGYVVLLFFKRPWRVLGIGLLFHMLTDYLDCLKLFGA
ncbi:DUF6122 family protein [Croceiramulus getboli]|nr:DUF6122 family protein [Flavobacteriaceae bacterium YJPT1-3]